VDSESVGGEYLLSPAGDLDLAAVPRLEREMRDAIDRYRPETLIVDLSKVSFMDCSGIGILVRAQRGQRARGGRLVVKNPGELVRRVLVITGMAAALGVEMMMEVR